MTLNDILTSPFWSIVFLLILIYTPTGLFLFLRTIEPDHLQRAGTLFQFGRRTLLLPIQIMVAFSAFLTPLFMTKFWNIYFLNQSMVITFIFAIFTGLSAALIIIFFDPQTETAMNLSKTIPIPVLGDLDSIAEASKSDCIRERINTSVLFPTDQKIIVCTALEEGSGKSLLAASLAKSYSRVHRNVLLLEADVWEENPNRYIQPTQRNIHPGFTDFIYRKVDISHITYYPTDDSFVVIPRGTSIDKPNEVLTHENLRNMLIDLQSQYSVIIIDAPNIHRFPEINSFHVANSVFLWAIPSDSKWIKLKSILKHMKKIKIHMHSVAIITRPF